LVTDNVDGRTFYEAVGDGDEAVASLDVTLS
jgi:hypothetical protein